MTARQLGMIQELLDLLSSRPLRDWTSALTFVNPDLRASDVSILKKKLKRAIRQSHQAPEPTRKNNQRQHLVPAVFAEKGRLRRLIRQDGESVGDVGLKFRIPSSEEFSNWLKIIGSTDQPVQDLASRRVSGRKKDGGPRIK